MRWSSLRYRILIVSTLVAVLIAAIAGFCTLLLGEYVIGQVIARNAERAAMVMASSVEHRLADARTAALETGTLGTAAEAASQGAALDGLRSTVARAGVTNLELALYDQSLKMVWSTSAEARLPAPRATRNQLRTVPTAWVLEGGAPPRLHVLLSLTDLPHLLVATPVRYPDGSVGILSVRYAPHPEQQVARGIIWPFIGIGLLSVVLTVAFIYGAVSWLLRRIDTLRQGADSIDAGRLDERLWVSGDDEIGVLAESINRLIERLERRSVAQSRFIANASHELASPVAGIRGYTNILRAWGIEDTRVRDEAIDAIDRESRRMARLTDDLLNLLHADQGLVLKTERFDLNALARKQLAMSASRWIESGIDYIGPSKAPLLMVGDPDRLEDILSILLDNASKYTPSGGTITLTTQCDRQTVLIDVADTGRGIAEEDLEHLFDRFYRTAASRNSDEGGFGLGLSIAKSIVEGLGGDISVQSVVGQGTTFRVRLPRGRV